MSLNWKPNELLCLRKATPVISRKAWIVTVKGDVGTFLCWIVSSFAVAAEAGK